MNDEDELTGRDLALCKLRRAQTEAIVRKAVEHETREMLDHGICPSCSGPVRYSLWHSLFTASFHDSAYKCMVCDKVSIRVAPGE